MMPRYGSAKSFSPTKLLTTDMHNFGGAGLPVSSSQSQIPYHSAQSRSSALHNGLSRMSAVFALIQSVADFLYRLFRVSTSQSLNNRPFPIAS